MSKEHENGTLRQKPKPKPEPQTYNFRFTPKGIVCYAHPRSQCIVTPLISGEISDFHDKILEEATNKINLILQKTRESRRDKTKCLSILKTEEGLVLAWTKKGISGYSSDEEICEALGI